MRKIAIGVAIAAVVNALLQAPRWAASGNPLHLLAPAPEFAAALVALWLVYGARGAAARQSRGGLGVVQAVRCLAAAVLAVVIAFALGETFTRAIYAEGFRPLQDLAFLPAFTAMLGVPPRLAQTAGLAPLLVLIWLALAGLAYRGLAPATWHQADRPTGHTRSIGLWALTLGAIAAGTISELSAGPALSVRMVRAVTPSAAQFVPQTVPTGDDGPVQAAFEPQPVASAGPTAQDVSVIVVESYGRTVFANRSHRDRLAPLFAQLDRAADEAGYLVRSGLLRSPAFGGRSWLADATILTGQWIADQSVYEQMFDALRWSVVTAARDAGVVSFYSAPGTTYYEDGWHALFPFDHRYIAREHDYRGPVFDFGRLTDQYLLHHLAGRRNTLAPDSPALLVAILVSNHVPFRVVPPYLEDWSQLGDGSIYHSLQRLTFENRWLSGGEYAEGFAAGVAYSLRSAFGYVTEHAREGELLIVVGDHQPRRPISEERPTTMVPFHLITRDPRRLEQFATLQVVDGWVPTVVDQAAGLEVLATMIAAAIARD